MKKCIQAAALGLLLAGTASAKDVGYRAHTPAQSPFQVIGSETPTPQQLRLEYRGRATIRAKYRFVSTGQFGDGRKLQLDLMPEPESQAQLPYLTRWAYEPGKGTDKVLVTDTAREVWVTNATEAAVALLGQELADAVMAGKHERISGDALIVIDGFSADYTCTSPVFTTTFVEVTKEISAPVPANRKLIVAKG